jgi:hypothetical protein
MDQPGYLYGTGDQHPRVGPKDKFHWRALEGITMPRWVLFNGNKEIGLELYATHEMIDVSDVIFQMLTGLNDGL